MTSRAAITVAMVLLMAVACGDSTHALVQPGAIALGPDGQLAVADAVEGHVVLIDAAGRSVVRGKGDGGYWEATALAWDSGGSLVALARRYSADVGDKTWDLVRFEGGGTVERWPLEEHEPGLLDWSMGLAIATDGTVYTSGLGGGAVVHFQADGRYLEHWSATVAGGPLASPSEVVAADGSLWVVEHFGHRVRQLDLGGRQLGAFGSEGSGEGQLRFPRALALCGGDWLAVADMGNFRVLRFDLAGRFLDGFEPAPVASDVPVQLVDLAISADCKRLYLADGRGGRVLVTTPQGDVLEVLD